MAIDNELKVRLLHVAKTQNQWTAVASTYPKRGEVCLEAINTSGSTAFKIKIGDGSRPYCRNTGTSQAPVWDFTSEYVLPYFGTVITAGNTLQVLQYYTYPTDSSESGYDSTLAGKTVFRIHQLSIVETAGETVISVDTTNYKEIRPGSNVDFAADSQNLTISVPDGSVSQKGAVQLLNSYTESNKNNTTNATTNKVVTDAIGTLDQSTAQGSLTINSNNKLEFRGVTETNGIIGTSDSATGSVIDIVGDVTTSDTGNSGIEVTTSNTTKNVHHKTVTQSNTEHIIKPDPQTQLETATEGVVDLVTNVSVDNYGHITGKETITSDKIIAADIKAPVTKTDNTTWNYRETGGEISIGEDIAKISKLRGNTIVWNQIAPKRSTPITSHGVTFTPNTDGSYTINGTATSADAECYLITSVLTAYSGHKILFSISDNNTTYYNAYGASYSSIGVALSTASAIVSIMGDMYYLQLRVPVGVTANNERVYFNTFDLTKMFGSDEQIAAALGVPNLTDSTNLTKAAENFEKLFPNSYYPYCEGRLVSLGGYHVKWNQLYDTTVPTAETDHKYYLSEVVSSTKTSSISTTISYTTGSTNRMCIDLTMMFGLGSEPTLEEFEAMFPADYYEYNAGTEMNVFDSIGDKKLGLISTGDIPDESEPHAVDMGLPSGLLWADSNIDITQEDGFAASPYQYGCTMFSWGNVDGHNTPATGTTFDYNWGGVNAQEPWYDGQVYGGTPGNSLTADIVTHNVSQDAAYRNVGAPWHMPSSAEFRELFDNCNFIDAKGNIITGTDKFTTVGGVLGIYLRSKTNGNRLFFSASGYGNGSSWGSCGSKGLYWSASFNSARYAQNLSFYSGGVNPQNNGNRHVGLAIRPVRYKKQTLDLDWVREIEYTPDGSSTPEKLFPYGLLSEGRVYDEVGENYAIKRVGAVDLGSLNWELQDGTTPIYNYFTTLPATGLPNLSLKEGGRITSVLYKNGGIGYSSGGNMQCYITGNNRIRLRNLTYSEPGDFKSAMSGVMLYYELATPVVVYFNEKKRLNYLVDDHGTEQQLPVNGSSIITSPFVGTFEYKSNFKDAVIDLIDTVNSYKNPVKSVYNTPQTSGKLAVYDSDSTVASSSHFVDLEATIETGDTINRLPTVQQMIDYVTASQASALQYKGTVSSYDGNNSVTSKVTSDIQSGWLYFIDTQFTLDSDETYLPAGIYNIGDFIVWNETNNSFDVITGVHNIDNRNITLAFGSTVVTSQTIAAVDGIPITVGMPVLDIASSTSGNTNTFIDSITYNNDTVSVTKKNIPDASSTTKGIVDIINVESATSTTPDNSVSNAYDLLQALNHRDVGVGSLSTISTYSYGTLHKRALSNNAWTNSDFYPITKFDVIAQSESILGGGGNTGYLKRKSSGSSYVWELDPYGGSGVMPYKSNVDGTGDVVTSSKTTAQINLLPTASEKILARTALREQVGTDDYVYHKISVGALENDTNIVLILNGNFN